jgi:RsiW-degrading membrane proteinase PrsW (M82 family)
MLDALAALVPVLVFLALLVFLDSFKLVPLRIVLQAVAAGAAAALIAQPVNDWIIHASGTPLLVVSRYIAPVLEESVKVAFVVFVIRGRRVGFLVDAAIVGFAVGAGFALLENVHYLRSVAAGGSMLWIVRGFGAAILHGATTSIAAIVAQTLRDRHAERGLLLFLPGWAGAVLIHSAFNHFVLPPVVATFVLLTSLPLLVLVVFERSEQATREWVGAGLDLDVELLTLITSGQFSRTRLGGYLQQLRSRFPGPVVADMFCLLRVELELGIRAKGMLLAREAGLEAPVDDDLRRRLEELRYLRRSIGTTGLLALKPLQVTGDRDQWHRFLLEQARGGGRSSA